MSSIPSRAAENLWWLGRYAERAEAVTRLLRTVHDRRNEFQGSANPAGIARLRALLGALTRITATYPGFVGDGAQRAAGRARGELLDLVANDQRPGTLAHAVRALIDAAYAVRDQLSRRHVAGRRPARPSDLRARRPGSIDQQARVQAALQQVMQSLLALGGLGIESMVRDLGWRFMDAGRRIEREHPAAGAAAARRSRRPAARRPTAWCSSRC